MKLKREKKNKSAYPSWPGAASLSLQPRPTIKRFNSRADARSIGGRVKPGHDDFGLRLKSAA
jgi:hypothetical protein